MTLITIDMETYYDKDYSLTKLSEVEYILDDRFEAIMVAIKKGDGATQTHVGDAAIRAALGEIDWDNAALLAHNTRFDGAILSWRYGYVPKMYLDTLSMCRATTHWMARSSSLKKVSDYLGLPPKGDEVVQAKGKRLADFSEIDLNRYRAYCARDTDNCWEIFQTLRPCFTAAELAVIDLVLRMGILPQVRLDPDILQRYLDEVEEEKAAALVEVSQIDRGVFSSNPRFAALLAEHGVEVPTKPSPTGEGTIPAIARGDWAFKELCADTEQPMIVQALLAARLSVKSTIEETRTRALLRLSRLAWPSQGHGWAPVPLKYSGARTHRFSGDDRTNWQNFRRGSMIRQAVQAPVGWRIVHRDASQIEARMTAWMAWCTGLLDAFDQGRDVYSEFASIVYGRTVTKTDVKERFVGKTAILGLGYGCGWQRFRHMLFIGNGGVSYRATDDEARDIVRDYRHLYPEIPELWVALGHLILEIIDSTRGRRSGAAAAWLLNRLPVEADIDAIVLPSGMRIYYPELGYYNTSDGEEICYRNTYGGYSRMYGAKCCENISQALSRIIITDIMLRVRRVTGFRPFLSTHDSLDYCVPTSEAADLDRHLEYEFALSPAWAEHLPLASEGGWGTTLLDAERRVNQ